VLHWVALGCSGLQGAVVVLQSFLLLTPKFYQKGACCNVSKYVVLCCSVLQCVDVCCSVLQCVATCRSVLCFVFCVLLLLFKRAL